MVFACLTTATLHPSCSAQVDKRAKGAKRHPGDCSTPASGGAAHRASERSTLADRNIVQNVESRVSSERKWRSGRGDFGAPGLTRANDRSRPATRAVTSSVRCPSGCPGRLRRLTRLVRGDDSTLPEGLLDRESSAAPRNGRQYGGTHRTPPVPQRSQTATADRTRRTGFPLGGKNCAAPTPLQAALACHVGRSTHQPPTTAYEPHADEQPASTRRRPHETKRPQDAARSTLHPTTPTQAQQKSALTPQLLAP